MQKTHSIVLLLLTTAAISLSPKAHSRTIVSDNCPTKESSILYSLPTDSTKSVNNKKGRKKESSKDKDFSNIEEQLPQFPGGESAKIKFLYRNIKYPKRAYKAKIEGTVIVTFDVDKDGSIKNPQVVKSVDPDLDKEALRLVGIMPDWSPAVYKGKPMRMKFRMAFDFKL